MIESYRIIKGTWTIPYNMTYIVEANTKLKVASTGILNVEGILLNRGMVVVEPGGRIILNRSTTLTGSREDSTQKTSYYKPNGLYYEETSEQGNVANLHLQGPSTNVRVTGGTPIRIDLSIKGTVSEQYWLAPDGTTEFKEDETMTRVRGDQASIPAPSKAGTYSLYKKDKFGEFKKASNIIVHVLEDGSENLMKNPYIVKNKVGRIIEIVEDLFINVDSPIDIEKWFKSPTLVGYASGTGSNDLILEQEEKHNYFILDRRTNKISLRDPTKLPSRERVTISTSDGKYCLGFNITMITIPLTSHISGDPYIETLRGEVYKMSNFEGYSRLLEGVVDDKRILINAFTEKNTEREALEADIWTRNKLQEYLPNEDWSKWGRFDFRKECFIKKIWIKYGEEECLVDTTDLSAKGDFKILGSKKIISFPTFTDTSNHNIEILLTEGLSLIVSKYENPQIKSSLKIVGNKEIKDGNGAMVYKMYQEDIEIEELKYENSINLVGDREPKDMKLETYLSSDGVHKEIKRLFLY